jgi:hypothetical protein
MHDDENALVVGRSELRASVLLWIGGLFVAWHFIAWGWINVGGTVWKGYQENAISSRCNGFAAPFSSCHREKSLILATPFLGRSREELVIRYKLENDVVADAWRRPVQILVSCRPCMMTDYRDLAIDKGGRGEVSVVLPRTALWTVHIRQSSNSDGSTSQGLYWWGVRSPRGEGAVAAP